MSIKSDIEVEIAEVKESTLLQFTLWLHYNRAIRVSLDNIKANIIDFNVATMGKNKYCNCQPSKGKAINNIWKDWHCTYCLKPIKKIKN